MKNACLVILLLPILLSSQCETPDSKTDIVETILMDAENLASTKSRIKNNDPELKYAFDKLIADAEKALKQGPFSVTNKEKIPPSGDKHDYASYSRYWWPDPNQPDGLPYIRRDGETNPASQSLKESDRQRIGKLGVNTETLGLAYYFTGDEKYAEKVAELLRVWFLDPTTFMNPNVNHAQCRPGHNTGTKSGVLDGRMMILALESAHLIANSPALKKSENIALKNWAAAYFDWLSNNKMALAEAASKNNHGSYYDVQAMYFALYANNRSAATKIAQQFMERRILSQIEPDGSMPEEMARTRPLFYSIYNLHALVLVAHLAKKVDVDVWKIEGKNSRLKTALDYLAPYTDPQKTWPHPTLKETDRMEMFIVLKIADQIYPAQNYLEMTEKLPLEKRRIHRANLVFPLLR